jgi:hypothetical protein
MCRLRGTARRAPGSSSPGLPQLVRSSLSHVCGAAHRRGGRAGPTSSSPNSLMTSKGTISAAPTSTIAATTRNEFARKPFGRWLIDRWHHGRSLYEKLRNVVDTGGNAAQKQPRFRDRRSSLPAHPPGGPIRDHTLCTMLNDLRVPERHVVRISHNDLRRPGKSLFRYFLGVKWSQVQILSARRSSEAPRTTDNECPQIRYGFRRPVDPGKRSSA